MLYVVEVPIEAVIGRSGDMLVLSAGSVWLSSSGLVIAFPVAVSLKSGQDLFAPFSSYSIWKALDGPS